jgi:DNA-directed RNA polymerase subunit RPC12/RpoP
MRIPCNRCGKSVSSEVPDETIIRAWVECPECIEKEQEENDTDNS